MIFFIGLNMEFVLFDEVHFRLFIFFEDFFQNVEARLTEAH